MKKQFIQDFLSITFILVLILGAGYAWNWWQNRDGYMGSALSPQYETTKYAVATTSVLYLATSTDDTKWIIPISLGVDQLNLNLRMTASSTSGRLDWAYGWSEDRIDWFSEDVASSTLSAGYAEHSATTTLKHQWLPASTSEVAKSVVIPNVNAQFLRINFERGVVYENLQLWAEVRSHTN